MIIIPGEQIKEVTAEGLTYVNSEGEEAFIDFELCFQRYLDGHTSPQAVENYKIGNPGRTEQHWDEFFAILKSSKYVADRNFDGAPDSKFPFIEFYTQPPVRFEFPTREAFDRVIHAMKQSGWRTCDIA